jgi:YD repeat-containing protein
VNTTTTGTYDGFHRLATVANASGTTSYAYDGHGDRISETDPDGNVTGYGYLCKRQPVGGRIFRVLGIYELAA